MSAWFVATRSDSDAETVATAVSDPGGGLEPGEKAPDFTVETLDGDAITLSDLRGRPVVLNFWASWCQPCRKEFPLLRTAKADDSELAIVGVSFRDIDRDARDFATEQDADWPLAKDPDGKIAAAYGVRAVPQTFFINRDGVIAARVFGLSSADALQKRLDALH